MYRATYLVALTIPGNGQFIALIGAEDEADAVKHGRNVAAVRRSVVREMLEFGKIPARPAPAAFADFDVDGAEGKAIALSSWYQEEGDAAPFFHSAAPGNGGWFSLASYGYTDMRTHAWQAAHAHLECPRCGAEYSGDGADYFQRRGDTRPLPCGMCSDKDTPEDEKQILALVAPNGDVLTESATVAAMEEYDATHRIA